MEMKLDRPSTAAASTYPIPCAPVDDTCSTSHSWHNGWSISADELAEAVVNKLQNNQLVSVLPRRDYNCNFYFKGDEA